MAAIDDLNGGRPRIRPKGLLRTRVGQACNVEATQMATHRWGDANWALRAMHLLMVTNENGG